MNKKMIIGLMASAIIGATALTACSTQIEPESVASSQTVPVVSDDTNVASDDISVSKENDNSENLDSQDTATSAQTENTSGDEGNIEIVNDYSNTDDLLEQFPIINATSVNTDLEEGIQNRLLTGFANWNRGYDAWEKWGDILYTPDSMYNIHGVRLTLSEYQMAMDMSLKVTDIQMGDFQNMVVAGDWAAIRYDITNTNRKTNESNDGSVMEFVNFKDYGEAGNPDVRVVEGWAGTIGEDYDTMSRMQTEEEKKAQEDIMLSIVNTVVPETDNLDEKYPTLRPSPIETPQAKEMKSLILQEFDSWNQGYDSWSEESAEFFSPDLESHFGDQVLSLEAYQSMVKDKLETTHNQRVSINNMIIKDDWAAIFYNTVNTNAETNEKTPETCMQFLHFAKDSQGKLSVIESWTK